MKHDCQPNPIDTDYMVLVHTQYGQDLYVLLSISYKHEPFYKLLQEDILTRVYGSHHFGRYQVAAHPVTRYYCYGAGYLLSHRDVLFYPIGWT